MDKENAFTNKEKLNTESDKKEKPWVAQQML